MACEERWSTLSGAYYQTRSLQIIVVENTISARGEEWVRLRLEEDNRLVRGNTAMAELDGKESG